MNTWSQVDATAWKGLGGRIVGGDESLEAGLEVSKAYIGSSQLSLSLPCPCGSRCELSFQFQYHDCCMLTTMMVMGSKPL